MKQTLYFLILLTALHANECITNPFACDGFGAQFQAIIYSAVYSEFHDKEYLYTPFKTMEHNYDNDPDFLRKKEWLINFIGNFEINNGSAKPISYEPIFLFCDSHSDLFANSLSLKKIKQVFRSNKTRADYFDDKNLHIAIHIRRPNSHDNRVWGTTTPDDIHLDMINSLRTLYSSKKPLFHLYSQGDVDHFKSKFDATDIVLHINGSIEESFSSMVLADVLVTTTSSFSYTAGLLSEGIVYYTPISHPPLPHWIRL